jgi:polysaccharide export outer membrane protein
VARLIDVGEILSTGNLSKDLLVRQADVIFVPTSLLGRAAVHGRTISQMIPINLGVFYRLDNND